MADEFIVTVVIAITILAALLIITNLEFITGAPQKAPVIESKVFNLGDFSASFVKGTKIHDLGSKEVSNGIFFGENKIRYHFDAPEIENVTIKFRVVRSNDFGPLFVKYNSRVVEQKNYAVGDYAVRVPKQLLNESSNVEIAAASSLWQIWAPNIYQLRNVEVVVKSFAFEPAEFEFGLGEEYATFKEGRIEFTLEENTGRFAALLNDREIFNDFARSSQSVSFKKEDVRAGSNRIKVIPAQGTRLIGDARVVVFWEK